MCAVEKARVIDPFGHAGLPPLGEIRMTLAGEIKMTRLCQNSLNVGTCLWHVYPNRWFTGLTSQSDVPTSLNSRNLTHPRHFYFARKGHSYFAQRGQSRVPEGVNHARLFHLPLQSISQHPYSLCGYKSQTIPKPTSGVTKALKLWYCMCRSQCPKMVTEAIYNSME